MRSHQAQAKSLKMGLQSRRLLIRSVWSWREREQGRADLLRSDAYPQDKLSHDGLSARRASDTREQRSAERKRRRQEVEASCASASGLAAEAQGVAHQGATSLPPVRSNGITLVKPMYSYR